MTKSMVPQKKIIERFGFSFERGGAHTARTMMLDELRNLLAFVHRPEALKSDYREAIENENCLAKRSGKTRALTYGHLVDLYGLDRSILLFRILLNFWRRDPAGQPLLALLCAYARDPILRSTATFIQQIPEGTAVTRVSLEEYVESINPGRFSKATLKSTAQNINSTWTQSGHLKGRARKIRSRAVPTASSVSYALLLGYLSGFRGDALFQSEFAQLLDCPFHNAVELAGEASRKGWIVFKRIGDIIEVLFPNLITEQEMEWLREQG